MKPTDKRFWIKVLFPSVVIIALLCGVIFYRHSVKFEGLGRVKTRITGEYNFYPYGFALIHNNSDLAYYKMCLDSKIFNTIDNLDFKTYSYLLTFGNRVEKLSYSWYDTFIYDVSPSYCKAWKGGNELLIVDYPSFTYRERSLDDASLIGNDSIYIYRLPHLPFLVGLRGS